MADQYTYTLVNPQNGNLAFKLATFDDGSSFDHVQRHNYYALIWVKGGSGKIKADFNGHEFKANNLFAFSPYQPFLFLPESMHGIAIYFHPRIFLHTQTPGRNSMHGVLLTISMTDVYYDR